VKQILKAKQNTGGDTGGFVTKLGYRYEKNKRVNNMLWAVCHPENNQNSRYKTKLGRSSTDWEKNSPKGKNRNALVCTHMVKLGHSYNISKNGFKTTVKRNSHKQNNKYRIKQSVRKTATIKWGMQCFIDQEHMGRATVDTQGDRKGTRGLYTKSKNMSVPKN